MTHSDRAVVGNAQTCNLTQAWLEMPAARLRLGTMTQQTPMPEGAQANPSPVARAEWNFRACFAVHLPCPHEHLLVGCPSAAQDAATDSTKASDTYATQCQLRCRSARCCS